MTKVIFIPRTERNRSISLINEIAEAVFGTPEQSAFSEEFVPQRCRIPSPKKETFARFLINGPKLLWAIQFDQKIVGFILTIDIPYPNSIGYGINLNYAHQGIASVAFNLIKKSNKIEYPIFGTTAAKNSRAQEFMLKLGFVKELPLINFCGEDSIKFKLNQP